MRLRSVSNFVSPGPRVPIPGLPPLAACLLNASPQPRSLGNMYCICAKETCVLPSLLFACFAKISKINQVLSTTFTLTTSSKCIN